jgi:DNA-binding CsgD family transcriptional regulator
MGRPRTKIPEDLLKNLDLTDQDVADRFGCSKHTVSKARISAGLRLHRRARIPTKQIVIENRDLFKTLTDSAFAARFGLRRPAVVQARKGAGIPTCRKGRGKLSLEAWTAGIEAWTAGIEKRHPGLIPKLGTVSDADLSRESLIGRERIRQYRVKLGIRKFDPPDEAPLPDELIDLLGKVSDTDLSRRFGIGSFRVFQTRNRLGIPAFPTEKTLPDELIAQLGKVSDYALAKQYQISFSTISSMRIRRGIPSLNPRAVSDPRLEDPRLRQWIEVIPLSGREVAQRLGISAEIINKIRRRSGRWAKSGGPRSATRALVPEILSLVRQHPGMSAEWIGLHLTKPKHVRTILGLLRWMAGQGLVQAQGTGWNIIEGSAAWMI